MAETGRVRIERARGATPTRRGPASAAEVRSWVVASAAAADDKQADDVVVLEVGEILAITDWFVICDGATERQVKTIVEAVGRGVEEAGGPRPIAVEGQRDRQWVLLDFGDFVVHVFTAEARRYYGLERLWSDVHRLDWRREVAPVPDAAEPEAGGAESPDG